MNREALPTVKWIRQTVKTGKRILILGLLLNINNSTKTLASSFIETVGTSTAVGTVLGASLLPFASNPMSQVGTNLATGAAAGAAVGLGIWIYEKWNEPSDHEKFKGISYYIERPLEFPTIVRADSQPVWLPLYGTTF